MRNFIAVVFVFFGFLLATGIDAPGMSNLEMTLQGFGGIALVALGMVIYNIDKADNDDN